MLRGIYFSEEEIKELTTANNDDMAICSPYGKHWDVWVVKDNQWIKMLNSLQNREIRGLAMGVCDTPGIFTKYMDKIRERGEKDYDPQCCLCKYRKSLFKNAHMYDIQCRMKNICTANEFMGSICKEYEEGDEIEEHDYICSVKCRKAPCEMKLIGKSLNDSSCQCDKHPEAIWREIE